jgi:hypothetical protein
MADKPKLASEYKSEQVELVRAACLYVATKLGDLMDDLLIVGGLVPSLIIDQETLGEDVDPHVGTMDLDVGLQLALLNEGRSATPASTWTRTTPASRPASGGSSRTPAA